MNVIDFRRAVLPCLIAMACPQPAAAFAIYTDRAAWTAALAATITIDGFGTPIPFGQSITFDSGVVSTGFGTNATVLNDSNTVANDRYSGRVDTFNHSGNTFAGLEWKFPAPIVALGGDWTSTTTGGRLTLSGNFDGLGNQTVAFFDSLGSPGTGFLGIIGAAAFSAVTLGTQTSQLDEAFSVDELSFAQAIAEPAACWLLALGLACAGLSRRAPRRPAQATAGANQLCSDSPPSTTMSAPVT